MPRDHSAESDPIRPESAPDARYRLPGLFHWRPDNPFLSEWLSAPMRVSALHPSSRHLARLMTGGLGPETGPVIELGPGSGVFTRALIARGVPEVRLALVEQGPRFADHLARRFPEAQLFRMDATRLRFTEPFGLGGTGAVVSGLPFLSMPWRAVYAILVGVFRNLRPGRPLLQFTYGYRTPVPSPILRRLGLRAERVGWTPNNLPPATVYRLTQRTTSSGL